MHEFPKLQGRIVAEILAGPELEDHCDLHHYSDGDGSVFHLATVRCTGAPEIKLVFNVPLQTATIFVSATDGDADLLGVVIANLEEQERKGRRMTIGSVIAFSASRLGEAGVAGVVLLEPSTLNLLCHLPVQLDVDNKSYRFLLVVYLSAAELKLWQSEGFDALMPHFDTIERDVVALPT